MTKVSFLKEKTAYEITYGDWSSDVCSSDLDCCRVPGNNRARLIHTLPLSLAEFALPHPPATTGRRGRRTTLQTRCLPLTALGGEDCRTLPRSRAHGRVPRDGG